MSLSEDQLRRDLSGDPDDWGKRLKLVERLADRWAGQEMDMLLTASPSAPDTEEEMRRVVDLANAHCPGYRGLKHVLDLFLRAHLTSSWAHFIFSQALFYTGEKEDALRHYRTSKSLNPSRSDPELDRLLEERGGPLADTPSVPVPAGGGEPAAESEPARAGVESEKEAKKTLPGRRQVTPVPPKPEAEAEEEPAASNDESEPEPVGSASESTASGLAESAEESGSEKPGREGPTAAKTEAPESETGVDETGKGESPVSREEPEKDDSAESKLSEEKGETTDRGDVTRVKKRKPGDENEEDPDSPFHTERVGEDGHPVGAAKKEDDSREKLSALSIALIAHVVVLFVFAFWQVVKERPAPPRFVSSILSTGEEKKAPRIEKRQYQRPQMPTATARMNVMTAPAISAIPMPEMNESVATFDPVGNGDEFGLSMAFGGGGGGSVSFFGSRSTSKRVVFVVDVSASMGGSKDQLMRRELKKSIESLPATIEYALIFFGGPAWFAGQQVSEDTTLEGQWVANIVKDGSRRHVWYEGWSEKERHDGTRTSALYHYALGETNLPRGVYRKATKSNIGQTLQHIDATPLIFGTDWRWPLMMAMNMKPDTIFFMTDGAFGTGRGVSKEEMINDLLEHNRKTGGARINTICMMVLQAREQLEQLARGTRGEFTLVLQDGTSVRGRDLDNQ